VEEMRLLPEADELGLWSTVEQLVRTLRVPANDADDLLARIATEAVRVVPEAQDVGVIVIDPDKNLRTISATGPVPQQLDELQMQLGTGPCLTAARKQIVVRMHDIAADTRWTTFCDAAQQCGVASMLCVPLYVDEQTLGTLSLYGDRSHAFRNGAEPIARMLAALSAVAVSESKQRARMERALANRDLIGQAKGILMHRHGVRSEAAFAMLRAHSQRTNNKLLVVAERVVETGSLE
jgi:GAF domain-containing protein